MIAGALSLAGVVTTTVTLVSMRRAARRSREPVWMTPRHPAGIAASTALVATSAVLHGWLAVAVITGLLAVTMAAAGVRMAQLHEEIRRQERERRAEFEHSAAALERLLNGDES